MLSLLPRSGGSGRLTVGSPTELSFASCEVADRLCFPPDQSRGKANVLFVVANVVSLPLVRSLASFEAMWAVCCRKCWSVCLL